MALVAVPVCAAVSMFSFSVLTFLFTIFVGGFLAFLLGYVSSRSHPLPPLTISPFSVLSILYLQHSDVKEFLYKREKSETKVDPNAGLYLIQDCIFMDFVS